MLGRVLDRHTEGHAPLLL